MSASTKATSARRFLLLLCFSIPATLVAQSSGEAAKARPAPDAVGEYSAADSSLLAPSRAPSSGSAQPDQPADSGEGEPVFTMTARMDGLLQRFFAEYEGIAAANPRVAKYHRLAEQFAAALGLDALGELQVAITPLGPSDVSRTSVTLRWTAPREGLAAALNPGLPPHPTELLSLAPPETVYFHSEDVDGTALVRAAIDGYLAIRPEPWRIERIDATLAALADSTGIDVPTALAGARGEAGLLIRVDEAARVYLPLMGELVEMPEPQIALLLPTSDDALFQQTAAWVEATFGTRRRRVDGLELIDVPMPPLYFARLRPVVAWTGHWTLLSTHASWAERLLETAARPAESSGDLSAAYLSATPAYRAAMKGLPAAANGRRYIAAGAIDWLRTLSGHLARLAEAYPGARPAARAALEHWRLRLAAGGTRAAVRVEAATSTSIERLGPKDVGGPVAEAAALGAAGALLATTALDIVEARETILTALQLIDGEPPARRRLDEARAEMKRAEREAEIARDTVAWLEVREAVAAGDHARVGAVIQRDLTRIDDAYQSWRRDRERDWQGGPPPTIGELAMDGYLTAQPVPPIDGASYIAPATWEDFPRIDAPAPPGFEALWRHPHDLGDARTRRIRNDLVLIDIAYRQYALDHGFDTREAPPTLAAMVKEGYFQELPRPPLPSSQYHGPARWGDYPTLETELDDPLRILWRHPAAAPPDEAE